MPHRPPPLAPAESIAIAEQLWPGLTGPDFRVSIHSAAQGWVQVEEHIVLTWRSRAVMILPASRALTARSLTEFARLRPRSRRLFRRVWAGAIRLRVPMSTYRIALHARAGTPAADRQTALTHIAEALPGAQGVVATMSVRRTANRKALLHLLTERGRTFGFAKLAWNPASSAGIRTEAQTLADFAYRAATAATPRVKVPDVLLSEEVNGFPLLVTAPLPPQIRRLSRHDVPSLEEYRQIAGDMRRGIAGSSAHVRDLRNRINTIRQAVATEPAVVKRAACHVDDLLRRVETATEQVEIGTRWHGDLSPWNVGRDESGALWCWDLENAHPDALFGLDIVHWHFSYLRAHGGIAAILSRPGVLERARHDLIAAGLDPHQQQLVHLTHRVEMTTRALEMGCGDGWSGVWVDPVGVARLATWPQGGLSGQFSVSTTNFRGL